MDWRNFSGLLTEKASLSEAALGKKTIPELRDNRQKWEMQQANYKDKTKKLFATYYSFF